MGDSDWDAYHEDDEYDSDVIETPGVVARCGLLLVAATILIVILLGRERLFVWRPGFLGVVILVGLALCVLALWRAFQAVRDEPDGDSHLRRGFTAAAIPAAGALLVLAALGASPLRLGFTTVIAVRDMGQGTVLELVRTPLVRRQLVLPRLRPGNGRLRPHGLHASLRDWSAPIETTRGLALACSFRPRTWGSLVSLLLAEVPGFDLALNDVDPVECTWTAVDRRGRTRRLDTPPEIDPRRMTSVGWSADGKRFVWMYRGGGLFVMDEDLRLRRIKLPEPGSDAVFPMARWIDDERLLLGIIPTREPESPSRWTVLTHEGEVVADLRETPLPWWRELFKVSQDGWIASLSYRRPTRQAPPEPPFELAVFNPTTRQWELRATLDSRPDTLAALDDGRLLWTSRSGSENVVRLASVDDGGTVKVLESCSFEALARDDKKFYPLAYKGEAGGWAVWRENVPGPGAIYWPRLLACHLETGETRTGGPLGYFGGSTIDIVDEGILTPEGLIPFAELEDKRLAGQSRDPEAGNAVRLHSSNASAAIAFASRRWPVSL